MILSHDWPASSAGDIISASIHIRKKGNHMRFTILIALFVGFASGATTSKLVDQSGNTFAIAGNKPTLVSLFFTSCEYSCSTVNAQLKELLNEYPQILGLSVSVDPAHDQPDVLRKYIQEHNFQNENWRFATGKKEDVLQFIRKQLKMPEIKRALVHSTDIVLLSPQGKKIGQYSSVDPEDLKKIRKEITTLLQ